MKKVFTILILMLSFNYLTAQTPHPLDFFPHHEGDIFEYFIPSTSEYFQNIITKDSLGDDGKYYIKMDSHFFNQWCVDTTSFEVFGGNFLTLLEFKLDADSGDTWTVRRDSFLTEQAEVVDVFSYNLFGEDAIVKIIEYSDSASGLYFGSYWLASKFGIIREYGDPPISPVYYMRGAKIDKAIYGTITSIENDPNEIHPYNFTLNQNYPNPFNPDTQIEFNLENSSAATLKVYNLIGEIVAVLIDKNLNSGFHSLTFNGHSLPSGTYIYTLHQGNLRSSKKMILIK